MATQLCQTASCVDVYIYNVEKCFSNTPEMLFFSPDLDKICGPGTKIKVNQYPNCYQVSLQTEVQPVPTHKIWLLDYSGKQVADGGTVKRPCEYFKAAPMQLRFRFSLNDAGFQIHNQQPISAGGGSVVVDLMRAHSNQNVKKDFAFKIECHRFILAARSSVFREMFDLSDSPKWEDKNAEIKFKEDAVTMKAFINFLYTDQLPMDEASLVALLNYANKYDVPFLKSKSQAILCAKLTKNNAIPLFKVGRLQSAPQLKAVSAKMILDSFQALKETAEMKALFEDPGAAQDILEFGSICGMSESSTETQTCNTK